jgi:two-component system, chemotaxis family, CheB/CheR fusion protein
VKFSPPHSKHEAKVGKRTTALRKNSFPIVGIGASAGGLEAFTQLLEHLPADTGMAFIIVQHLDPQHESSLPRILSRATTMPVREVVQGMSIRPNEVYVIPPNSAMSLLRGRLVLTPRESTRAPHLSIDIFFHSLARELREGAIGVVFSGNAMDGTNGLEAIKAEGGITFAQDKSARYDSMPRSAVASGCVDYVMAPAAIAGELVRLAQHPYLRGGLPPLPADRIDIVATPAPVTKSGRPLRARVVQPKPLHGFAKIMELARELSGVDFSLYKTSTIHRRITRRMLLSRKNSLDEYAEFVAADLKELKALYVDLLICVTSFFRDEAAFDAIKKIVFPKLLAERRAEPLRIWTIGCSSGQEAYSLGMAFLEATEQLPDRVPKLQIFGTDLNEALLNKARHGLYPKSIAQEISPERLRKFFIEEDGGYRVIKALREICIFARQDLLSDPPFSRMDLVSCRNVLIYIEPVAQKRILPMLHYALKPNGYLFLGSSESVGSYTDLFEACDKKLKIFARKSMPTPAFSIPRRAHHRPDAKESRGLRPPLNEEGLRTEAHAGHEADRVMVNLFAPPGVLVDAGLNVLQFHGATEAYLTPSSGKASFQLLKLARDGLMLPLRAAINQARKQSQPVRREKVRVGDRPGRTVTLHVIPLKNLRDQFFLVLFEDSGRPGEASVSLPPPATTVPGGRRGESQLRRRNLQLERELRETRDYLQSLQQQHDTAHDELQASTEEVQSTNEELQSINEELETSKEELESGNEELITVNEEMAYRNGELSRLNSDLNNFHVSISTPIVVLGRDLTVRRFTPAAEKLFNLLASDIGRSITGIKHNLEIDHLEDFVGKVIDLIAVREAEVRDKEGHWYLLRARPYLTVDNKIDGAVLVLLDIDALKRSEQMITEERDYAEATLRTARDALVILRPDFTVNTANDAFYRTFNLTPAQTENRLLFDLADGAWNIPALRQLLADVLPRNHFFNDLQVTHEFGLLGERTMLLNGRRLDSAAGEPLRIVLSIEDITERQQSRLVLRASEIRYRRLFEAAKDGVLIIDPESRQITDVNPFMVQLLGYRRDEFLGKELFEIGLFRDQEVAQDAFAQLKEKQQIRYEHLPLKGKDGVSHQVEVVANLYDEDGRAVIQCNVRDITERKQMEDALRRSEARFQAIIAQATAGIATIDLTGKFTLVNERFCAIVGRTAAELMELRSHDITHPDDQPADLARFVALAKGRQDFSIEKRYLRPDGSIVWVSNSVAWITGDDDAPHGFVEISEDISERKQLKVALQVSEAYFRELTQNLPIGVWTSLPDGRLDFINRHWLEYTGQTFHEAMMSPDMWLNTIHPDDRVKAEQISKAGWAAGKGYVVEARFRHGKSGDYRWFLKRSLPVQDAAGNLQKRIGICIDIDDLKRAQNILAAQAGVLEEQVQVRTGELRETIGELEAFSYSVSHDMRAPLRAMQGFAQLLLTNHEATLDPRSVDQLRRISASANRLDALINDVLTYSRLLRSEIVLQPVNLDELVRRIIATYPQLQVNGAEITIEGTLPVVLANEASLTQCISNLLTNAVKFVAPGTSARVRIHADETENDARLWIEDNGIGIDPRDHERIWTIFTRIGRLRDYEGTGIGLAIVRKAVERMQGTIGMESTLGQGSKFWLRLRKG